MPKTRQAKVPARVQPTLNPHAADADLGARGIYVALPADATASPVRRFDTFTANLRKLLDWLQAYAITTLAMEATSVYRIPLAEMLEQAGIEIRPVNPRPVKNVPGRRTDVADWQWLQYLPPRRPAARGLSRHREARLRPGAWLIPYRHQALDQMNLQIVEAILEGERDPAVLADLGDQRLRAGKATPPQPSPKPKTRGGPPPRPLMCAANHAVTSGGLDQYPRHQPPHRPNPLERAGRGPARL